MEEYRLPAYPDLAFGHRIVVDEGIGTSSTKVSTETFDPVPGVYMARDLVALNLLLLDSAILRLGPDDRNEATAQAILIRGLAATLATSGRESTLPVPYSDAGSAKAAIGRQAQRIASTMVDYVRQMSDPVGNGDMDLQMDSHCERRVWTPEAASLLLGPRGDRQARQLYNEWLHQSILLRDALIPFENYEDVPLVIPQSELDVPLKKPGVRAVEDQRARFLTECRFGRQISESAFVDLSKVFTAPKLSSGGYGFQYTQGLILPAFLSGPASSPHLLRFHPARVDHAMSNLLFECEKSRYDLFEQIDLSRTENLQTVRTVVNHWRPSPHVAADTTVTRSSLGVVQGHEPSSRILKIKLYLNDHSQVSIDLGQIARGRQYAYSGTKPSKFDFDRVRILLHNPLTALKARALITCHHNTRSAHPNLLHVFPATDPLVYLALLGKIHANNVVLLDESQSIDQAIALGKSFGPMIVIYRHNVEKTDRGNTHAIASKY